MPKDEKEFEEEKEVEDVNELLSWEKSEDFVR